SRQLEKKEPITNSPEELSQVLLARFGLLPRKKDSAAKMHKLLLELTEKKKRSVRNKSPEIAITTVEEMALHAGIARQTMYDYLPRWLSLNILKKSSFVLQGKVIIGYELNGNSLESAFRKAETVIKNHLDFSFKVVETLQKEIKREKLRITTSNE
ncbi:hypothetical protein ACFLZN_01980, partial [Nanoarchaeota archaeon]